MLSKKEIKDIQSLSEKKYREGLKLFPAEGPKIVSELMELIPGQIIKVYAIHDWITRHAEQARRFPTIEVSGVELKKQCLPVFAVSLHGKSLYQHTKIDRGILIIGNESRGISRELMDMATEKITIPKKGGAESLNAAVAAGIILSHLLN